MAITFASIYQKMKTEQRTPVQKTIPVITEQPISNQEFDYASETASEAPKTVEMPVVTETVHLRQTPRPDIPPLVESDVTRYLKPKTRALLDEAHGVFLKGGAIGDNKTKKPVSVHEDPAEAKAKATRMNKQLSPGEKKHYGLKYHVKPVTENVESADQDQPTFKSVREYITSQRNKRAQHQLKVIDNA